MKEQTIAFLDFGEVAAAFAYELATIFYLFNTSYKDRTYVYVTSD